MNKGKSVYPHEVRLQAKSRQKMEDDGKLSWATKLLPPKYLGCFRFTGTGGKSKEATE